MRQESAILPADSGESETGGGCRYVTDDSGVGGTVFCGAPRLPGSAYCPRHHARCRVPGGSAGEQLQLQKIEALAEAVGGRQGGPGREPPQRLLRRLARIEQAFSRPNRSRFVREMT